MQKSISNSQEYIDLELKPDFQPSISLALSGGGSRGLAQIGVLMAMEENSLIPNYIAGTSIGAIVGALYASGYSSADLDSILRIQDWEAFTDIGSEVSRNNLFFDQKIEEDRSIITLSFQNFKFVIPEAISIGSKLNTMLLDLFWSSPMHPINSDFNTLRIPFKAVATDISGGEVVYLDSGNLATAVRASATVPLRFTPVRIDNMILVDGGVLENIPTKAAETFDSDLMIAVNTTSSLMKDYDLDNPLNVADQVVSISMVDYAESSLDKANWIIKPELTDIKNDDFSNIDLLIKKGYESFSKQVESIQKHIDSITYTRFCECYEPLVGNFISSNNLSKYKLDELLSTIFEILNNDENIESIKLRIENGNIIHEVNYHSTINNIRVNSEGSENENFDDIEKLLMSSYRNSKSSYRTIESIKLSLLKILRKKGYSFARIKSEKIVEDELIFIITISRINKIKIDNQDGINEYLIKRDLEFEVGDIANSKSILKSWKNLIATDYFTSLEFDINELTNNSSVNIKYKEAPMQEIKLGARIDNERDSQFGVDIIQNNLFNTGSKLGARLNGGTMNFLSSVTIENPRIFNSSIRAGATFLYHQRDEYSYMTTNNFDDKSYFSQRELDLGEQTYGTLIFFGANIEKLGTVGITLKNVYQRFYHHDEDKGEFYTLNNIVINSQFDSRDDSYFPSKGRKVYIGLEANLFETENTTAFSKLEFNSIAYTTIGRHTIAQSLQFGLADETMPRPEHFGLGGMDSFFGMNEEEMRGRQLFKTSLEYRYKSPIRVFFDTYLSFRYDLGAVWSVPEEIKFSGLRHGAGFILSLDSPLGPLQLGTGRGFFFLKDPNALMLGRTRVYFRVGIDL